ncbi:hypothetical protein DsansV1_C15g0137711 [Dioscorea sansibarensis]
MLSLRSAGMEVWLVSKRDMQPLILKSGLGLALTGAGFYSLSSDLVAVVPAALRLQGEEQVKMFKCVSMEIAVTPTVVSLIADQKGCEDDEGFLLPEFSELVTEEFETQKEDYSGISPVNYFDLRKFVLWLDF